MTRGHPHVFEPHANALLVATTGGPKRWGPAERAALPPVADGHHQEHHHHGEGDAEEAEEEEG